MNWKSEILKGPSRVLMLLALILPQGMAETRGLDGGVDRTVDHVVEPWAPTRWIVFALDPWMTQIVRGKAGDRSVADRDASEFEELFGLEFSTEIRRRIDSLELSQSEAEALWRKATEEVIAIAAEAVRALEDTPDVGVLLTVPPERPELGALTSERTLEAVIEGLRNFSGGDVLLQSPQVEFLQIAVDSCWIRDYGPFVGVTHSGRLVLVDAAYSNQPANSLKFALNLDVRLRDDQFPQGLGRIGREVLESKIAARTVSVIKSPLVIPGGDFTTDGHIGFGSVNLLALNGMDAEELTAQMRALLGVDDMVYLEALPGMTVKHIDMFFQVAAPNVYLLGTFGAAAHEGAVASLVHGAAESLNYNLRILSDFFESRGQAVRVHRDGPIVLDPCGVNIVLVPMPEPSRPVLEEFEKVTAQFERARDAFAAIQARMAELRAALETCDAVSNDLLDFADELAEAAASIEAGAPAPEDAWASLGSAPERFAELRSMSDPWLRQTGHRVDVAGDLEPSAARTSDPLDSSAVRAQAIRLQAATNVLLIAVNEAQQLMQLESEAAQEEEWRAQLEMDSLGQEVSEKDPDGFYVSVESQADVIRTYLNYLFVRTGVDQAILLVPRYEGHEVTEQLALPRIASVYEQLYGDVDLRAIPADALIQAMGAIHCVTWTSPRGLELRGEQFGVLKRNARPARELFKRGWDEVLKHLRQARRSLP